MIKNIEGILAKSKKIASLLENKNFKEFGQYLIPTRSKALCYKLSSYYGYAFLKIERHLPIYTINKNVYKSITKVDSKNVIKYYEIEYFRDSKNGYLYLLSLCEYLEPVDIFKHLNTIKNNDIQLLNFLTGLLNGFNAIHKAHFLHRDVNFCNVLFSNICSSLKISDINLLESRDKKLLSISPEFMAPEVSSYSTYTLKSELWAIGVLIHVLLTNKFPFRTRLDGLEVTEVIETVRNGRYNIESRLLPPIISKILPKLLEFHPEDRYTDLDEILENIHSNGNMV